MKKLLATITAIFLCSGIILLYLTPSQGVSQTDSPYNITYNNSDRKKILIFSCKGGGGHVSASNALKEYLEPEFCVGCTCILDMLRSVDFIRKLTNNKLNIEDSYNFFLKRNWNRFLNFMTNFLPWYHQLKSKQIFTALETHMQKHKPDLLISVAPVVNNELLRVAEQMDIPFILIPTDLNAELFSGEKIKNPSYSKFHLALSYNDNEIFESLHGSEKLKKHTSYVGYPVKKSFLEPHHHQAIKKNFNIPNNKPVILLMMGAQGSKAIYTFTSKLTKLTIPAHIVIVLGKSEHMMPTLHSINFPKHISRSILGFTNRIADLMSISDLLITKSGGASVNEAIYAQVPMILDATSSILSWEEFNQTFIEKNGLGKVIKKYTKLPYMVTQMLSHGEQNRIRKNLALFDKKNPEQEIKRLVKQILFGENKQ